jgi:hypothetical protein
MTFGLIQLHGAYFLGCLLALETRTGLGNDNNTMVPRPEVALMWVHWCLLDCMLESVNTKDLHSSVRHDSFRAHFVTFQHRMIVILILAAVDVKYKALIDLIFKDTV